MFSKKFQITLTQKKTNKLSIRGKKWRILQRERIVIFYLDWFVRRWHVTTTIHFWEEGPILSNIYAKTNIQACLKLQKCVNWLFYSNFFSQCLEESLQIYFFLNPKLELRCKNLVKTFIGLAPEREMDKNVNWNS